MATIWIWNSIASRRRSSSDTFVENGLGVLAGAVEKAGHRVRIIDWARSGFYDRITPVVLARPVRALVLGLMKMSHGHKGVLFKAMGMLNLGLQQVMAFFQKRRMAAALRRLAREVAASGIRIFGMKVWYGEAFTWAKYLANEIRKLAPDVLLVAGGYHATLYEEDFLRHSPFDLAVISEGEAALTKILDVISASPVRREEKSFTEGNPAAERNARCRAGEGNPSTNLRAGKGAAQRGALRAELRFLRSLLLNILPATGLSQVGAKTESCSSRQEKSFTEDNEGNKGAAQRGALRAELRFLCSLLLKIFPVTELTQAGTRTESTSFASAERDALLGRIREEITVGRLTNVVYRDGDEIRKTGKTAGNINAKTVSFYGDMSGKVRLHVLLESSGCPWGKCHFCVHHHLEPEYLRRRVDKIVEEIRLMREQGIGLFRFAGSDTPPEFGAAIAEGILASGMRLEYAMGSRAVRGARHPEVFPDLVDKYALMIRSGLRAVFMGGETGHDVINDQVMNKGLGRDDLLWTIRALREAEKRVGTHVDVSLAMIYPTPLVEGVTDEEVMAANLSLIAAARPDSVMVTPPGPFKNSEWFNQAEKFGFELDESFIPVAMEYEYVLYKPPELWPKLGLSHNGRSFVALLKKCGLMRSAIEELGIPTDLSDEHFITMRAAGYEGADGARAFKRETLADIVSCDYRRLDQLTELANAYSLTLAGRHGVAPERPASMPAVSDSLLPAGEPVLHWESLGVHGTAE